MKSILAITLCTVGLTAFADDLGGVQLWKDGPYFAECNVGAKAPQESGWFFWWGDTVGYTNNGLSGADGVWASVVDGTSTILFNQNEKAIRTFNKSFDELRTLDDGRRCVDVNSNLVARFDAANAKLGDPWRMMTQAELKALIANTKVVWTNDYNGTGIAGHIVTGATDGYTDKSIFLPATHCGYGKNLQPTDDNLYWTSTAASGPAQAWSLHFTKNVFHAAYNYYRYCGCPVRAVRTPPQPIVSPSNEFALDLTAGDRIAKTTETIVVDPAWGNAKTATVKIDGEEKPRTYTTACDEFWRTGALAAGRYTLALTAGDDNETAAFWKVGDGWEVFDGSNITADKTFEPGKTYLVLGTNTVTDGVKLTVTDGAKLLYDKDAPAGFLGGDVDLPKRYETKTVEGDLYQIDEKIKGCEDNPWEVGGTDGTDDLVTAWTNGTELVIGGTGAVTNLADVAKDGLTAIKVTEATVTGAAKDAFAGVGGEDTVMLTLPDNWQGELPDKDGNWYGATGVELMGYPMAVKNVEFLQRYPWNGLVDIACDLSGTGEVTLGITVLTNGVKFVEAQTITGETTFDLGEGSATNGVKFVWDAAKDLPAGFKAGGVQVKVTAEK